MTTPIDDKYGMIAAVQKYYESWREKMQQDPEAAKMAGSLPAFDDLTRAQLFAWMSAFMATVNTGLLMGQAITSVIDDD
jgi:hypothetical protein